jgi:hypothetical protein
MLLGVSQVEGNCRTRDYCLPAGVHALLLLFDPVFLCFCVNLAVSLGLWFVYTSQAVSNEERTIPKIPHFLFPRTM